MIDNVEARKITDSNPTGIRNFDHREFAELPEYVAASRAIDRLVHAINRVEDIEMGGQAKWLEALTDMAAALPYSDCCPGCSNRDLANSLTAPAKVDVEDDGWLHGTYRCSNCGHSWTCNYAVDTAGLV